MFFLPLCSESILSTTINLYTIPNGYILALGQDQICIIEAQPIICHVHEFHAIRDQKYNKSVVLVKVSWGSLIQS